MAFRKITNEKQMENMIKNQLLAREMREFVEAAEIDLSDASLLQHSRIKRREENNEPSTAKKTGLVITSFGLAAGAAIMAGCTDKGDAPGATVNETPSEQLEELSKEFLEANNLTPGTKLAKNGDYVFPNQTRLTSDGKYIVDSSNAKFEVVPQGIMARYNITDKDARFDRANNIVIFGNGTAARLSNNTLEYIAKDTIDLSRYPVVSLFGTPVRVLENGTLRIEGTGAFVNASQLEADYLSLHGINATGNQTGNATGNTTSVGNVTKYNGRIVVTEDKWNASKKGAIRSLNKSETRAFLNITGFEIGGVELYNKDQFAELVDGNPANRELSGMDLIAAYDTESGTTTYKAIIKLTRADGSPAEIVRSGLDEDFTLSGIHFQTAQARKRGKGSALLRGSYAKA